MTLPQIERQFGLWNRRPPLGIVLTRIAVGLGVMEAPREWTRRITLEELRGMFPHGVKAGHLG